MDALLICTFVLIWLNLSTSSPVRLPLRLQLSGTAAEPSDWLTPARLACAFMHARLIISPCVHFAFQFYPPPCLAALLPQSVQLSSLQLLPAGFYFQVILAVTRQGGTFKIKTSQKSWSSEALQTWISSNTTATCPIKTNTNLINQTK